MRPPKQGLLSFPSHMFVRNGIYYYRSNVPADLQHYFPTAEVKKSVKTKDYKTAKLVAISFEYKVQQTYAILRTGMLHDDMIQHVVERIVPSKQKVAVVVGYLLSDVIMQYVEARQAEWTSKSKMEFNSVFRLLSDILGDVEVKNITKFMVLELRSSLQRLPSNLYKKHPGKTIKQVLECEDVEPMSTKSVNKHVARLGALLRYCVDEGMIAGNPASGLKITEKKRADEERNTYSRSDIEEIIRSLPKDPSTPERYWIPLIGLYSGMRLNEICQLYVSCVFRAKPTAVPA